VPSPRFWAVGQQRSERCIDPFRLIFEKPQRAFGIPAASVICAAQCPCRRIRCSPSRSLRRLHRGYLRPVYQDVLYASIEIIANRCRRATGYDELVAYRLSDLSAGAVSGLTVASGSFSLSTDVLVLDAPEIALTSTNECWRDARSGRASGAGGSDACPIALGRYCRALCTSGERRLVS